VASDISKYWITYRYPHKGPGPYRVYKIIEDKKNRVLLKSVKGNHIITMDRLELNYDGKIFKPFVLAGGKVNVKN
jgi:streptogramin lyase